MQHDAPPAEAYASLVETTELIWTTIRAGDHRCDRDESRSHDVDATAADDRRLRMLD
jgi:hypothetical protein